MRQTIQLAFSPSRVLDFGQQRQKRGELHGNLGSSDSGCLSKSQRFCVAGILNRCGNLDSPLKYRGLLSLDPELERAAKPPIAAVVGRVRRGPIEIFLNQHET